MEDNMIITNDVQKRFFDAIEHFTNVKKIGGLQTFCKEYGFNRPRYSHVKNRMKSEGSFAETKYKTIDIAALIYLCRDYKVNPDWLILGKGKMF